MVSPFIKSGNPAREASERDTEIRFLADRMLGKLATYLRILGFDTDYFRGVDRMQLIAVGNREGRVILSRDTRLLRYQDLPLFLFIRDDRVVEQVTQVVADLGLEIDWKQCLTRCLRCNQRLVMAAPEEINHKVPPYILTIHQEFSRCPQCERVYWRGTHQQRMLDRMRKLLGERKVRQ